MDIRDSIRKQFSKKSKLQEATKWNPDNQPNIYELDNFLRKSGYRLIDIIEHKESSLSHSSSHNYELIIEPITPGYLHPEISHDYEEGNFYAKITEHGLLVASDIEEIIKGYTTVLGVLKYLGDLDIDKLEVSPEDRED